MEYLTPNFTKDMLKDYTVLVPNMCPVQFRLVKAAMESEGYHRIELIGTGSSEVTQLGLKYVHNDTCYPALIIIGQFLDALNSGKYDVHKTALLITQSGGGCRASNYIKLLRKALVRAGYDIAKASPLQAVARSQTPTLFIHGQADDFVPARMMPALYRAASCPKAFQWVPEAGHVQSVIYDPELYWARIERFLHAHGVAIV